MLITPHVSDHTGESRHGGIAAGAGIRFAQVERTYSERGELRPGSGGGHGRLPPHKARWLPIRLRGTYSQLATGNCASNAYSICLPWER